MPILIKELTLPYTLLTVSKYMPVAGTCFFFEGASLDAAVDRVNIDQVVKLSESREQHLLFGVDVHEISGEWHGKGMHRTQYSGKWVIKKNEDKSTSITFTMEYPGAPQPIEGTVVDLSVLRHHFEKCLDRFVEDIKAKIMDTETIY